MSWKNELQRSRDAKKREKVKKEWKKIMIQLRSFFLVSLLMVFVASKQGETIKIGLLIPDKEALAAKHGAELAIRKANEKGGYSGIPFQLIVRSTEGPWGTGSMESVSLVFDDKVVAIMGSLDGRNAHLAEQVATKTKLIFLSAWATDMTLSKAFVPWYFRCLPNDRQQAISLIQEVYFKNKIKNVAIIGTDNNDSQIAMNTFIKIAKSMNVKPPEQFLYNVSDRNYQEIFTEIEKNSIEAILLFGKPAFASEIIPLFRQCNIKQPVFGSLSILDDQKASSSDWSILEDVIMTSSGQWFTGKGIAFQKEFQKEYGYQPGPAAAYAYDGINVIVEAIRSAKPHRNSILDDRDKIIDVFSKTNYSGITGGIQFDENGNRTGKVGLMKIKEGKPVQLKIKN
ncbi:MAG: ABC transporter substrate-binding protein [Bacteroidales bacterium]|nr:ABC transporter substrate-binding protein [Bacteroidales bacterium]